jgi:MFS family permease
MPFKINKRAIILIELFFLAFFLRFIFINKGPFHYDTLDLAIASQKTLDSLSLHYESHGTGFPLTVIVGAFTIFVLKFFGVSDPVTCVNFMSVVTGALGVLLLFFVADKLFDFPKAMFSAFLLACFAPHVAISTFGKSLTLSICLALASVYFMLLYKEKSGPRDLFLSAVFLGFCAAVRLSDALVALPISYLYFSGSRINRGQLRSFVAFAAIAGFVAFIYYFPLVLERGLDPFFQTLMRSDQSRFLGIFSFVSEKALRWEWTYFTPLGVLCIAFGFLLMLAKKKIKEFNFLAIWFIVLHSFYGNVSSSGPRYLVIAWVAPILALGYFLGSFKGRLFYWTSIIFLILAFFGFERYIPVLSFRHERALQVEFAQWVAKKTPVDSTIIAMDESIFLKYYGKRRTLGQPNSCDEDFLDKYFDEEIGALLKEGKKVYAISTGFRSYDPCGKFETALFNRYNVRLIGKRLNEDWHHVLLDQAIFKEGLCQITLKP